MSSPRQSLRHSRWLRWPLLAFPRPVRQRHGEALVETWMDLLDDEPLRLGKLRAAWDLLRNGWRLRLEGRPGSSAGSRSPEPSPPPPPAGSVDLSTRGERIVRELRFALRRLLRQPAFSITAIVIVALGIGANTTIFSIVNGALFKPLAYERPEDLVRVYMTDGERGLPVGIAYPEFLELQQRQELFEDAAFHADITFLSVDLGGSMRSIPGEFYSANFFRILGMEPSLGRSFLEREGLPGEGQPVAMISHSAWRKRFGSDPQVLGTVVQINGLPVTVVGVGPEGFRGTLTGLESELYLPWGTATQVDRMALAQVEDRGSRDLFALARLQPGVSREAAQSALTVLASNLAHDHPATNEERTLQVFAAGDVRSHPLLDRALLPVSAFFMVLVGLVLMVSISNLANLMLAKAAGRRKEMALRLALGAQRRQLVSQLLMESTLLAGAGGLVGLATAFVLPRWLLAADLPIPLQLSFDFRLDGRVLAFALLLSLATGLLFGIAPALAASRAAFSRALGGDRPWSFGGSGRSRLRDGLIVVQVAVSTLLLAAGALFLHSLLKGQSADPGFETENAALANVDASSLGHRDEGSGRRFWRRYQERVEALPGADRVALTSRVPMGFLGSQQIGVSTRGTLEPDERPERTADLSIVSPSYWQVMEIPILQGRSFRREDDAGAPAVAVVSRSLAESLWGAAPAVGQHLALQGRGLVEVVGVAGEAKVRRLTEDPRPLLYLPFEQRFEPWMTMVVATERPAVMKELLRREFEVLAPGASLFENKTMTEHLGFNLFPAKVASTMLVATGFLALALASIGLYGMIALAVARRTREVGIRAALGATRPRLISMVVGEALKVVAVGLVLGLAVATLALQPLKGLLYGISPFDPISFAAVALVLGLVTLIASYLPARRTARIDVVSALKAD